MNSINKNTIIVTIVSLAAIFGFLTLVYIATNKPQENNTVYEEIKKPEPDDHIKWSKEKKHILVEYSDLQCPACKSYHDVIKTDIEKNKPEITKKITFVYKHYPLVNVHQNALAASYAAEAAGKQNKFFEMVDKLFEKQDAWATEKDPKNYFSTVAKELKLDVEKFKKDMDSNEIKEIIQKDLAVGNAVEVRGTPSFYLDGKKLENVASFDEFVNLLAETAKK